jgi:hypothetical protein
MNEPSNQTGGFGDTFSSQPAATGTNPFTADLKGEFTSNFGTNTNAVSQIFKEGGFVGQNKTKYFIIGGVVFVVVAILAFALIPSDEEEGEGETAEETSPEDGSEEAAATDTENAEGTDTKTDEEATAEETKPEGEGEKTAEESKAPESVPESKPMTSGGGGGGGGPVALTEPADGSSLNYDESQGPAMFTWTGGGGHIVFSRNSSMSPVVYRVKVSGNQYAFHHPWPGTWYWKVENGSGSTEVRSFKVNGPARRNLQITEPSNGSVAGNGGVIAWQGDSAVAYYRVEISNSGWANPTHRFATSGNSVKLEGVTAGSYQMRVGAFSEVSGRFEYTAPASVTVQ